MADNNNKPKKHPIITTPRGIAKFPKLGKPDTKFNPEGDYSVKLVLTPDQAEPLINKLKPLFDEAVKAGQDEDAKRTQQARKKAPFSVTDFYQEEWDKETDSSTGNLEFNFKMKASGVSKKTGKPWSRKPAVFDGVKRALKPKDAENIWTGSVIKVAFEPRPYFIPGTGACGLSLALEAVQVIELKSGGQRTAEGYGFEEEEDGYSHTPVDDDGQDTAGEDYPDTPAGEDGGDF